MQSAETAVYCIGSVVGIKAREQFQEMTGTLPDVVTACVGGGSNAMGLHGVDG